MMLPKVFANYAEDPNTTEKAEARAFLSSLTKQEKILFASLLSYSSRTVLEDFLEERGYERAISWHFNTYEEKE